MKAHLRLRKPTDFKRVFREGKRFSSPHFVLYVLRNGLPFSRLGVTISKEHFKLATRRNKLRRIIKEWFRNKINTYCEGCDFIVASNASHKSKDLKEILQEVKGLMSEVGKSKWQSS